MARSVDYARAKAGLDDLDQRICDMLAAGRPRIEIQAALGLTWRALHRRLQHIRHQFEQVGFTQ